MNYTIGPMTDRDYVTLQWLADRGYDGSILENSEAKTLESGDTILVLTEPQVWDVRDYIESDWGMFLAYCGSSTLAKMLMDFWQKVV